MTDTPIYENRNKIERNKIEKDAYQKFFACSTAHIPIQNQDVLVSVLGPGSIQDSQQSLFIVAAGLLSHSFVNRLSKQLDVSAHDILHDMLVPNAAGGEQQLIRTDSGARFLYEFGDGFEWL